MWDHENGLNMGFTNKQKLQSHGGFTSQLASCLGQIFQVQHNVRQVMRM